MPENFDQIAFATPKAEILTTMGIAPKSLVDPQRRVFMPLGMSVAPPAI
jgi:hypothetical protein